jgi:hypothetical protein
MPPTTKLEKAEILFLSLAPKDFFDTSYASLVAELEKRSLMSRVKTADGALLYLGATCPRAIIITDEGITLSKHSSVFESVENYLRAGGTVIIGLQFCTNTEKDMFNALFRGFGLTWTRGANHRTDFCFNTSCTQLPPHVLPTEMPLLPSMQVLHIKGAKLEQKIMIPVPGAMTQSQVLLAERVDETQAAVVCEQVGKGFLIYNGNFGSDEGSVELMRVLCGLVDGMERLETPAELAGVFWGIDEEPHL